MSEVVLTCSGCCELFYIVLHGRWHVVDVFRAFCWFHCFMMLLTTVQVVRKMDEIALDCSPLFFVGFWWYLVCGHER